MEPNRQSGQVKTFDFVWPKDSIPTHRIRDTDRAHAPTDYCWCENPDTSICADCPRLDDYDVIADAIRAAGRYTADVTPAISLTTSHHATHPDY